MQPEQLKPASFASYPPEARAFAVDHLGTLQALPLVLAPILLRELIVYDWKLPAERRELQNQFTYLADLSAPDRETAFAGFHALMVSPELCTTDWVKDPGAFMDRLTAHLWSTHQMEHFRTLADAYSQAVHERSPSVPPAVPRLGVVVLGAGVEKPDCALFRKLRPEGVSLTRVRPESGLATLLAHTSDRASGGSTSTLDHWYIEGGEPLSSTYLTQVSYARLEAPRAQLATRIQQFIASGNQGPEGLRSLLARTRPADLGLPETPETAVLSHFQTTLLTEGAGAQIFATTFVQWAARECIRRAQPETLLVRYAPRQRAGDMNAMLTGAPVTGLDPQGSLVDADMGAYYTYLSLRRLPGADQLRFLVWFEGHAEAVAIGPSLPRGTSSNSPMTMQQVLQLFS